MKLLPLVMRSAVVAISGFLILRFLLSDGRKEEKENQANVEPGTILDTHRGVPVCSNGDDYTRSHGKHYSDSGYYYGQKWQCVEFVKRFYHDSFGHRMPSVWGHAKDFYDPSLPQVNLNAQRDMVQYANGGSVAPRPDDLLVFNFAPYGHVAVIAVVRKDEIEVIQQNVTGKVRQTHPLVREENRFSIESTRKPVGWLRLPRAE